MEGRTMLSFINCPQCRKIIREDANACPGCGIVLTPEVVAVQKQKNKEAGMLLGAGLFLFICIGVFVSWKSSPSSLYSPSSSSSPTNFETGSFSSITNGIQYDDTTDRKLKNMPSLQGYSDSEKEYIISNAKKLKYAVDGLKRQRGY
jgi:hypothetical protein